MGDVGFVVVMRDGLCFLGVILGLDVLEGEAWMKVLVTVGDFGGSSAMKRRVSAVKNSAEVMG